MIDAESPLGSALVEIRTGRVVKVLTGSPLLEVLELIGSVTRDVLGKHQSPALAALFERLRGNHERSEDQEQFREVIILSEDRAFFVQKMAASDRHALVSVYDGSDRRLGVLISGARRHLRTAEDTLFGGRSP